MSAIRELLDRIIEDGVLTPEELTEFAHAVNEDREIDQDESREILRLFTLIGEGKVKVQGKNT